jgi:hypothetical protein
MPNHVAFYTRNIINSVADIENSSLASSVVNKVYINITVNNKGPPLWSSGQSSWLQIRRSGFDSRHCQKKK